MAAPRRSGSPDRPDRRRTIAIMVGDLPVIVVLDADQVLTDELVWEIHQLVHVVRDAGLVTTRRVAAGPGRRDDRKVPDPGVGTSGRRSAPRPWSGPGTKGYGRRRNPPEPA